MKEEWAILMIRVEILAKTLWKRYHPAGGVGNSVLALRVGSSEALVLRKRRPLTIF